MNRGSLLLLWQANELPHFGHLLAHWIEPHGPLDELGVELLDVGMCLVHLIQKAFGLLRQIERNSLLSRSYGR